MYSASSKLSCGQRGGQSLCVRHTVVSLGGWQWAGWHWLLGGAEAAGKRAGAALGQSVL